MVYIFLRGAKKHDRTYTLARAIRQKIRKERQAVMVAVLAASTITTTISTASNKEVVGLRMKTKSKVVYITFNTTMSIYYHYDGLWI